MARAALVSASVAIGIEIIGVTEFTRSAAYIATAIATRGVDTGPTEQAAAAAFQSANGFRTARS